MLLIACFGTDIETMNYDAERQLAEEILRSADGAKKIAASSEGMDFLLEGVPFGQRAVPFVIPEGRNTEKLIRCAGDDTAFFLEGDPYDFETLLSAAESAVIWETVNAEDDAREPDGKDGWILSSVQGLENGTVRKTYEQEDPDEKNPDSGR